MKSCFSSFSRPGTASNASGEPWGPSGCTPGRVCGGVDSGRFFKDFDSGNRPGAPGKNDSRAVFGVFPDPGRPGTRPGGPGRARGGPASEFEVGSTPGGFRRFSTVFWAAKRQNLSSLAWWNPAKSCFSSFSRPGTVRNASGEPWGPLGCTPGRVCGGVDSGRFFKDFDSRNRPGAPKKHDSRAVSGVFPGPHGHRVHFPAPGGHAGTVCGAAGGGFPSPLEPPRNRLTHGFFASDIYKIKPSDPVDF